MPSNAERYATVRTSFLNGGAGEAIRNVSQEEFEQLYKRFGFGEIPKRGVGACGDGLVNFQWKIYNDIPDYSPSLSMRLLPHQIRKVLAASEGQ